MTHLKSIKWRFVTALTLIIAAGNAPAENALKVKTKPTRNFAFNGVGTHSCGKYIENVKGLNAEDYKNLYQQWGAGFMAGASNEGQGANPTTDLETYTAWLDKWCADDPASNVVEGVIALGKRLSQTK